ncbi:hypothetical protein Nepgr_024501 [Nepenthes gracilis]|uniref:Urease accessory protein F n=1 Tax=Nepenthes gracilis TaxID=150966 RepID=A0AAD3T4B4_NEPGR|nr:hypothetical protein Nepgr_024501 [Nepenthes gracilis]
MSFTNSEDKSDEIENIWKIILDFANSWRLSFARIFKVWKWRWRRPARMEAACCSKKTCRLPFSSSLSEAVTLTYFEFSLGSSTNRRKMVGQEEGNRNSVTDSQQQWNQWQLLDSILPTGGFAHSLGLEAAIQARIVNGPQDLYKFVILVLENVGSLLLPFVHTMTIAHNEKTWHKLDRMLDAMLSNETARKASTAQGSALLRVAATVFTEITPLKLMRERSVSSNSRMSFHHAPIFGLVCGLLGFDLRTSQRAYVFIAMRDVLSAATRLSVIGPQAAAILQHQITPIAEEILNKWIDRNVEDACQTAPVLDVIQGCHPYLFSKLFCS